MPIRYPRRAGLLLKTGQTTQYSGELDNGYYQKGLDKRYSVLTTGQHAGTVNVDLTHLVSDTGAFTSADQTYTDAGKCGVFKAAGGETIVITGSASNNGTFTTVSATANTVVVTAGFVNEADAPMTTFKKREAMSNACVLDNNTGLMWNRTVSLKMGIAGDGKMPWTGQTYDIFAFCAACNAMSLGGYTDWRVPDWYELAGLFDTEVPTGYPNSTAFPVWGDYHWSSSTCLHDTTAGIAVRYLTSGVANGSKTTAYLCALVRG
jgi:hypothetical protein